MATVYNHDIASLVARIDRFTEELIDCESSSGSEINQFDLQRLNTYLDSLEGFHAWAIGQPALDLPESHPRPIELPQGPATPVVENESINDIVRLIVICKDELINSQSVRQAANFKSFDSSRFLSVVQKIRAFLTDYVAELTPLDLPESSPRAAQSGPGRRGSNP